MFSNLSHTGLTIGSIAGFGVLLCYLIIVMITSRHNNAKKINRLEAFKNLDSNSEATKKENTIEALLNKLEITLKECQIKMNATSFVLLISAISLIVYIVSYFLSGTFIIPLCFMPFPIYYFPNMLIESKRKKIQERFDLELIMVLRRMSAITKNDSILRALQDVKDYPAYSEQMRLILNKIYLLFSYGESIEDAFKKVAAEYPSKILKQTAISIDLNKSLGSDLSLNLHEISAQVQNKMLMQKEASAIMMQTVYTAKLMSFMPYAIIIFLFVYNKAYFADYFLSLANQLTFAAIVLFMDFGVIVVDNYAKPPKYV